MRQVAEFVRVTDFVKKLERCTVRCMDAINLAKVFHAKELLKQAGHKQEICLPEVDFDTSGFVSRYSTYLKEAENIR